MQFKRKIKPKIAIAKNKTVIKIIIAETTLPTVIVTALTIIVAIIVPKLPTIIVLPKRHAQEVTDFLKPGTKSIRSIIASKTAAIIANIVTTGKTPVINPK
jgi:hypothetical protein